MALDLGTPEGIAILIAILAVSVCICAWCKSCLVEVLERCGSYFESVYFDWEERREEKKRQQLEAREKRIEDLKRQRSDNDLKSKDLERQEVVSPRVPKTSWFSRCKTGCQTLGQKLKDVGRSIAQKTGDLYSRCKRSPSVSPPPPPIPPRPRHRPKLSRFFTRKPQPTRVSTSNNRVRDMIKSMERRSSN